MLSIDPNGDRQTFKVRSHPDQLSILDEVKIRIELVLQELEVKLHIKLLPIKMIGDDKQDIR